MKLFGSILVDPPWNFKTYSGKSALPTRSEEDAYTTLTKVELLAFPAAKYAALDCALFMWVVDSHLNEALALGSAWGFSFKTCAFVWAKTTQDGSHYGMGMGYWTRKQTEQCWLFTRGHPKRLSAGVRQVIEAPRREHSRKPDEQYERIEALVGGPYLELFARQKRRGWTSKGNETTKFGTN